jgi:anti-anti-sigma regulatory factor
MNNEIVFPDVPAAVVQPEGDLVAAKLPALRSKLQQMVGSGVRRLTIDLTLAQIVDSAGGTLWRRCAAARLLLLGSESVDGPCSTYFPILSIKLRN